MPGSVHDLTAARTHQIIDRAQTAWVELMGDKGYQGAGPGVTVPHRGRRLTDDQKRHNQTVNRIRGRGERGLATLKNWRILLRFRGSPHRVGLIARAILTLELGPNGHNR